ncbi:MAG TPA: metalloregulator ArsR/SmtB family transcription factor [Vineibacter sp.]|nr:metalloregulator ArsR/SmtB family transcription factor [Vineibacter sp.]
MRGSESTTNTNPKRALYDSFAAVAQALAHGSRLELLEHVAQGERSVEALAAVAGLNFANASQHLLLLRRAGLVRSRRDGKRVLYRLSEPAVLDLLGAVRRIAESNVAEARDVIAGYFQARDSLEPVSRHELADRLRRKAVTLLDVRPSDEFALGHVAGAINIPLKELLRRLDDLPRGKEVVAYCRGAYCVLSFEAVALLRRKGFRARRFEAGYPEWRASGLPVRVGSP